MPDILIFQLLQKMLLHLNILVEVVVNFAYRQISNKRLFCVNTRYKCERECAFFCWKHNKLGDVTREGVCGGGRGGGVGNSANFSRNRALGVKRSFASEGHFRRYLSKNASPFFRGEGGGIKRNAHPQIQTVWFLWPLFCLNWEDIKALIVNYRLGHHLHAHVCSHLSLI